MSVRESIQVSYVDVWTYNSKGQTQQVDRPPRVRLARPTLASARPWTLHVIVLHRFPHQVQSDALAIVHVRLRWVVAKDAIDHNF